MTSKKTDNTDAANVKQDKRKSEKIENPIAYFSDWVYDIQPHHWEIFGVSKREFMLNKKPYMAWALNKPETTDVFAGYIFYLRHKQPAYIQIAATWETPSTGECMVEAHYTTPEHTAHRVGTVLTAQQLRDWIKTGVMPPSAYMVDKANSKGGSYAWALSA